jgi:hypothetical protein
MTAAVPAPVGCLHRGGETGLPHPLETGIGVM